MTLEIRKQVLDQIRERRNPMDKKADSLTEISSIRWEQRDASETKESLELFSPSEELDDVDSEDSDAFGAVDDCVSDAASVGDGFLGRDRTDSYGDDDIDTFNRSEESDEDENQDKDEDGGVSLLI